jgi:hypothetical protein
MPTDRWRLVWFKEALRRWNETSFPPGPTVEAVSRWITEKLPYNPMPAGSLRFNSSPEQRYVVLPFRSNEDRFVLVAWHMDVEAHELRCILLEEVDEGARP